MTLCVCIYIHKMKLNDINCKRQKIESVIGRQRRIHNFASECLNFCFIADIGFQQIRFLELNIPINDADFVEIADLYIGKNSVNGRYKFNNPVEVHKPSRNAEKQDKE